MTFRHSRKAQSPRLAAHLLNRAAFGPAHGDIDSVLEVGFERWIDDALAAPGDDPALEGRLAPFPSLRQSSLEIWKNIRNRPDAMLREDLHSSKIIRCIYARNQLIEVLTDFWYNHFNVMAKERYPLIASYERDAIRPHVLGKFRNLLGATARHPAMLTYLDNTSNVANRYEAGVLVEGLNENYGRELMELHTISVQGGYHQPDVVDTARAFTGWQADCFSRNPTFAYAYVSPKHDCEPKRVMALELPASRDEEDGEGVLDYLASHPSTARFVAYRLTQRLLSDEPPMSVVNRAAETFATTGGDLRAVTNTILRSDEFWSDGAIAMKVKTPLEFVASAIRAVGADVSDARSITHGALLRMGMLPYECSPPCGYSNRGSDWLNGFDWIQRFNFACKLAANELSGVKSDISPDSGIDEMWRQVFGRVPSPATAAVLEKATDGHLPRFNKMVALTLASPEFQWH